MENKKIDISKADIDSFLEELDNYPLSDYHNFKLHALAQKIRIENYRPKPRMLYL